MKWWYLTCKCTLEYAIVYACSKKAAFRKLASKREISAEDYSQWTIEELNPDNYDGIIYFS